MSCVAEIDLIPWVVTFVCSFVLGIEVNTFIYTTRQNIRTTLHKYKCSAIQSITMFKQSSCRYYIYLPSLSIE